jgi:hypothetical protein
MISVAIAATDVANRRMRFMLGRFAGGFRLSAIPGAFHDVVR